MREFLQLAHTYNPKKHGIGGWYVSEKLDGMRAYWDGGWTRGTLTSQVPFANTVKDYRRVTPPHSTGLWSRYAKPIAAPDWWLDSLPVFPLDGELYLGRGRFQELISTVKKFNPVDSDWEHIEYRIFDIPSDYTFLAPGKINNPQWSIEYEDMRHLAPAEHPGPMNFEKVYNNLLSGYLSLGTGPAILEPQVKLSMQTDKAARELDAFLEFSLERGGEGVVLRKPESIWTPKRTNDLLKLKPWLDSEATVIDYVWGKGKLEGLMGAMVVEWHKGNGQHFELSGFTDAERILHWDATKTGDVSQIPGYPVRCDWENCTFPRGSIVTFRYRELTDAGIPKEARYWRKHVP